MGEPGIVGFFYLKEDLSLTNLISMLEKIKEILPQIELHCSIEDIAHHYLDGWTNSKTCENPYMIYNGKYQIVLSNLGTYPHPHTVPFIISAGQRHVMVSINTTSYGNAFNELDSDLGVAIGLAPLFCLIGHTLGAFFGFVNDETVLYIHDERIATLDSKAWELIREGDVSDTLRAVLRERGVSLVDDAWIEMLEDDRLYIFDGDRMLLPKQPMSWEKEMSLVDCTKRKTLKGVDFLEEMLRTYYWLFYLDRELYESIGPVPISRWARLVYSLYDDGCFITNEFSKWPIDVETEGEPLAEIHGEIMKRIRREFSIE